MDDGRSTSLAFEAWQEVLPEGSLFPQAAEPWTWVLLILLLL